MPRVNGTRKQKAAELKKLIEKGPSLYAIYGDQAYTPEEAMRATRGWLDSWVMPLVQELVPELRRDR